MNEEQRRTDATLAQYLQKWQGMNDAQRRAPDGMGLMGRIHALVRVRNGGDAADEVLKRLNSGKSVTPDMISDIWPRIDGDSAAPKSDEESDHNSDNTPPPRTGEQILNDAFTGAPGSGRKWLPSNESLPQLISDDEAALNEADAAIEEINAVGFHVDPNLAWRPSGAELPNTGINISTLGDTYNVAKEAVPKLQAAVDKLSQAFGGGNGSGEKLIDNQYARIKAALQSVHDSVAASSDLHGIVARCGIAANNAFHHHLRGSDLAAREKIRDAVRLVYETTAAHAKDQHLPSSEISRRLENPVSHGEFRGLKDVLVDGPSAPTVDAEAESLGRLTASISTPAAVEREKVGGNLSSSDEQKKKSSSDGGTPAKSPGTTPGAAPPKTPGTTPGTSPGKSSPKNANDLNKLLSQLGHAASPMAAMPQQAAAVPQQAAQAAQQAAQPLTDAAKDMQTVPKSLMDALNGKLPENQKAHPMPSPVSDSADADRRAATSPTFTKPGPANPDKLGAPGSPARPHQLDADGKPVDKDRDGKVDKDAKPLSKASVKPFNLRLDTGGEQREVSGVPDPRLGEMMLNMAEGTEESPVSVLDAAKDAGMDIESLGDPVDPDQAKVGDAVIGDEESGIYLGDGQVLTSSGEVADIEDVTGETGFVSEIPMPELPDEAPAVPADDVAEASPPAPQEPIGVPAEDGPPPPVDAMPVAEAPAAPPEPAAPAVPEPPPAPAPADPAAATVGPADTADSSEPKQVAYEGRALG